MRIRREHRPIQYRTEPCGRGYRRHGTGMKHRPIQFGAELRFPPFAHRAFGFMGTGAVDEAWKNAEPPVPCSRLVKRHHQELTPRRHENRPLIDQWHGVDGVIHALSTATIPKQSSRGGQRVGNPLDDLGRWPFSGLSRRRPRGRGGSERRPSNPLSTAGNGVRDPVAENIARFNTPRSPAVADTDGHGAGTEHRPIQSGAESRFRPFAHRAFGFMGDRRRGRSVENARPLVLWSRSGVIRIEAVPASQTDNIAPFIFAQCPDGVPRPRKEHRPIQSVAELQPRCPVRGRSSESSDITDCPPRRHENRFPSLIHWHGADGIIHALSTATIPKQSSRGGQRVGNPLDDLGHGRFRPFTTPPARSPRDPKHRPFRIRCRRSGNGVAGFRRL